MNVAAVNRSSVVGVDFNMVWQASRVAKHHPGLTWFSCTASYHEHSLVGVYRLDFQQPTDETSAHYVALAFAAPNYSGMRLVVVDDCELVPADPAVYLDSEIGYRTESIYCHADGCEVEIIVAWRFVRGGGAIELTCAEHRTVDRWTDWSEPVIP